MSDDTKSDNDFCHRVWNDLCNEVKGMQAQGIGEEIIGYCVVVMTKNKPVPLHTFSWPDLLHLVGSLSMVQDRAKHNLVESLRPRIMKPGRSN